MRICMLSVKVEFVVFVASIIPIRDKKRELCYIVPRCFLFVKFLLQFLRNLRLVCFSVLVGSIKRCLRICDMWGLLKMRRIRAAKALLV